MAMTKSAQLMGGIAALMMSVLLSIIMISSNRRITPSVKMAINLGEPEPLFRVFHGQQLCAEGETYCEHPCNAFYTITGKPTDCYCKCTVNTRSFEKGDVICTCPDSPISAENDYYPHPPNITNATAAPPQANSARYPSRLGAFRHTSLQSMAVPVYPAQTVSPFPIGAPIYQPSFAPAQSALSYKWAIPEPGQRFAAPAIFPLPGAQRGQRGPQGLWVGAPPQMNPPDGDYPGGSSGIPLDGYIGFETGYMNDGPYHGMYEPLQDAGLYAARRPQVAVPRRAWP